MSKIAKVLQHDETDCAAACIAIILRYYGKNVPLRKIRREAGTDTQGTSGYGLQYGAKKFGLSCRGMFSPNKILKTDVPLPAVFHLLKGTEHYVVVYKIRKNKVFMSDPDSGLCSMSIEKFKELWTGIFFILCPLPEFRHSSEKDGILLRYLPLLAPYKKSVAQVFFASIILSMFGIFISFYFRFLIDEVLYAQIKSSLNACSLCYLLAILFQTGLLFCRSQIISYLGEKIDVTLLGEFFSHLLHLPMSFFSSRKTGEVLSRINDAETIRNAVSSATLSIFMDAFMLVIGGAFLVKMGMQLVPVAVIPVMISSVIVWAFARPFRRLIKEKACIEGEKNASIYESINGIATIKALAAEMRAFDRAETLIVESAEKSIKLNSLGNAQNALEGMVSGLGTLAMYWVGSNLIFTGKITLGQLISFVTLSGFFLDPLRRLLTMQMYLQEVAVSAERLADIMDVKEENDDRAMHKEDAKSVMGDIEFKDVSFSYGTRGKALEHVSLKIPAGKKVAFVGTSGSGKTTLLKLLMKFYKCDDGKILINGKDIECYSNDSYREKIGYVPQESLLFSGTVRENISWGCDGADDRRIEICASAAQASEFIERLPDKYDTFVGEQGATLSGGERQRLALARVFMHRPQMLVMDEATASLDSISEQAIMKTIYKGISNHTVIMVAHRLSTVRFCDIIYVFSKGHLVEQGNHEFLLSKKGVYASLWTAQNGVSSVSGSQNRIAVGK